MKKTLAILLGHCARTRTGSLFNRHKNLAQPRAKRCGVKRCGVKRRAQAPRRPQAPPHRRAPNPAHPPRHPLRQINRHPPIRISLSSRIRATPTGLCPLGTTNVSVNGPILPFLYDSLVRYNSDTKKFEPAIASSWKYIDDTHIEFKLRQDVTAWDGSKITANDVIFTYKTADAGGFLGNYVGKFDIPNCKAVDDTTVILATKVAEPYIFNTIANACLGIESQ